MHLGKPPLLRVALLGCCCAWAGATAAHARSAGQGAGIEEVLATAQRTARGTLRLDQPLSYGTRTPGRLPDRPVFDGRPAALEHGE
jgi:hypothetical protein